MKKLMVMLGAVAVAAGVQAATMSWTITAKLPGEGGAQTGEAAKTSTTGVTIYDWALASAIDGSVWSAVASGDATTGYTITAPKGSTALGAMTYKGSTGTAKDSATFNAGDTAYAAAVLVYDANGNGLIDGGDWYLATQNSWAFSAGNNKTLELVSTASGPWTKIEAAPEPTSGLLLLLGVAGLALRRRRA